MNKKRFDILDEGHLAQIGDHIVV